MTFNMLTIDVNSLVAAGINMNGIIAITELIMMIIIIIIIIIIVIIILITPRPGNTGLMSSEE